jgi:hypothetical protein
MYICGVTSICGGACIHVVVSAYIWWSMYICGGSCIYVEVHVYMWWRTGHLTLCVHACVRACVRVCVRACVCARALKDGNDLTNGHFIGKS